MSILKVLYIFLEPLKTLLQYCETVNKNLLHTFRNFYSNWKETNFKFLIFFCLRSMSWRPRCSALGVLLNMNQRLTWRRRTKKGRICSSRNYLKMWGWGWPHAPPFWYCMRRERTGSLTSHFLFIPSPRLFLVLSFPLSSSFPCVLPFFVHSKSSFVPSLHPFPVLVLSFFPSSLILSLTSTFNFHSSFSCSCLQIFPSLHPFPVLVLSFSLLPILSLSPTIICPFQTLLFPPFLLFSLSSLF